MEITLATVLAPLPMLGVHLYADRLVRLSPRTQHAFGSFAGGTAAAYVFLIVLPKLSSQQKMLELAASSWPFVEYLYHHAYLVALGGFVAYYLVNSMSEERSRSIPATSRGVLTVIGFALYSALIGDLVIAQGASGSLSVALFSVALSLHLLGLDHVLFEHFTVSWRWLRWLLAGALVLGWLAGAFFPIRAGTAALLSAWLGGAIIIHVVLLELPNDRNPRAFVLGVATFTLLIKLSLILEGREGGV
jgi:hypothetical protein